MMLRLGLFTLVAWSLAPSTLEACTCVYRGPVCKWFPNTTDAVFVGRAVEMEPGSDYEFSLRIETALRPYLGEAIAVNEWALEGEALKLYLSIYAGFWRSIIPPEALDGLSSISNYGEFVAWRQRSGVDGANRRTRFAVSEAFAGDVGVTVDIYSSIGTTCSTGFSIGEEYIVVASRYQDQWHTGLCSGNRLTSDAREDLEYLRAYAVAGGRGSFAGTAYVQDWNPENGSSDSSPADGAEIEVSNETGLWATRADQNGRFSIGGLQPGQYSIAASYQGRPLAPLGLGPAAPQPVHTVPPRGCAFMEFTRPPPSGSITGRVFAPVAQPAPGFGVTAVPVEGSFSRHAQTDQDGRFEIKELQPGSYFVGVNIDGEPNAYHPYARVYYPGVPNRDLAGVLQVSEGVVTDIGVLRLGPKMRVRKIRGRVVGPDGQPISEVTVRLIPQGADYGISDWRTTADGGFELEGLEEFAYSARAEIQNPRNGQLVLSETAVPANSESPITIVLTVP